MTDTPKTNTENTESINESALKPEAARLKEAEQYVFDLFDSSSEDKADEIDTKADESTEEDSEEENVEETTDSDTETEDETEQLTLLAKKERHLKAKEKQITENEQKLREYTVKMQNLQKMVQSDPLKAFQVLGGDPEEFVKAYMGGETAQPNPLESKVVALESRLAQLTSKEEKQKEEEVVGAAKKAVDNAIAENDTYFWLNQEDNATKLVLDYIEKEYNENGVTVTVEEAAGTVNEFYQEKAKRYEEILEKRKGTKSKKSNQVKTLNQEMSGSVNVKDTSKMTIEERLELARKQTEQHFSQGG